MHEKISYLGLATTLALTAYGGPAPEVKAPQQETHNAAVHAMEEPSSGNPTTQQELAENQAYFPKCITKEDLDDPCCTIYFEMYEHEQNGSKDDGWSLQQYQMAFEEGDCKDSSLKSWAARWAGFSAYKEGDFSTACKLFQNVPNDHLTGISKENWVWYTKDACEKAGNH